MIGINKKYDLILCDPPWEWKTYSEKGQGKSASQHYSCMTLEDIKNLPIIDIANENSMMFMWATSPLINKQIEIMEYWGFTYKTVGFVWVKTNKKNNKPFFGLGQYTRANAEYLLIGRHGKGIGRPLNKSVSQIDMSKIREHSRKPDSIKSNISLMYPLASKIELFAREQTPGWDVWGNECDKFGVNDAGEIKLF